MKRKLLLSTLTSLLLLGTTVLNAQTDKKELVQKEAQAQIKNHKQAPKEIVMGLQNTYKAMTALQQNKKENAIKLLEEANKSFDVALKADPSLKLIPIDERLQAYAFMGSSNVIEDRLKLAVQLLKAHETQDASDILLPLKDELDITTVSIPMNLYPVSTKKALEALKKDDIKGAAAALNAAMTSLVTFRVVIPTPILAAQDLIAEASKLDKTKKEDATKLLDAAKEELKRAELLGYTSKHAEDYKALNDDIEKIQKEIKGENKVEKLYETLKNEFLTSLKHIHISKAKMSTPEETAEKKVNAYENEEAQKALKVKAKFNEDSKADEAKTIK